MQVAVVGVGFWCAESLFTARGEAELGGQDAQLCARHLNHRVRRMLVGAAAIRVNQCQAPQREPARGCCRALNLPTMPSLSMHTKHGVVRRRDDGVLDMVVPHPRGNGGH